MQKSKATAKSLIGTTRTEPFEGKTEKASRQNQNNSTSETNQLEKIQIRAEELELQPRTEENKQQPQPENLQRPNENHEDSQHDLQD
jgi:hypothetical protein